MTSLSFRSIQIPQTWYQYCVQPLGRREPPALQSDLMLTYALSFYYHKHATICAHSTLWPHYDLCLYHIQDVFSRSKLFLCAPTARLFEQGEASERLHHRQLAMDFVVPRTHVDTVCHLLLLSNHCQDTGRQTPWGDPGDTMQRFSSLH